LLQKARLAAAKFISAFENKEASVERGKADVQFDFLNSLVTNQTPVWVFLVNGIKLSGVIAWFDKFVLSVQSPSGVQMVYKNAVSTVIEQHALPVSPTRVPTDRPRRRSPGGQP